MEFHYLWWQMHSWYAFSLIQLRESCFASGAPNNILLLPALKRKKKKKEAPNKLVNGWSPRHIGIPFHFNKLGLVVELLSSTRKDQISSQLLEPSLIWWINFPQTDSHTCLSVTSAHCKQIFIIQISPVGWPTNHVPTQPHELSHQLCVRYGWANEILTQFSYCYSIQIETISWRNRTTTVDRTRTWLI